MKKRILITGGAGFIGSHLADELLAHGYVVRALDNLAPQVHGPAARRPEYLHPAVELCVSDVRDPLAVRRALQDVSAVCHLAAAVGRRGVYRHQSGAPALERGTAGDAVQQSVAARR